MSAPYGSLTGWIEHTPHGAAPTVEVEQRLEDLRDLLSGAGISDASAKTLVKKRSPFSNPHGQKAEFLRADVTRLEQELNETFDRLLHEVEQSRRT